MTIKIRKEVMRFAELMEKRLRKNEYKGGWKDCDDYYLLDRLEDEVDELKPHLEFVCPGSRRLAMIRHEAADVANFAMMIADNTHDEQVE